MNLQLDFPIKTREYGKRKYILEKTHTSIFLVCKMLIQLSMFAIEPVCSLYIGHQLTRVYIACAITSLAKLALPWEGGLIAMGREPSSEPYHGPPVLFMPWHLVSYSSLTINLIFKGGICRYLVQCKAFFPYIGIPSSRRCLNMETTLGDEY